MANHSPIKNFKTVGDAQFKLRIKEESSKIINQVDIDTETILLKIHQNPLLDNLNKEEIEAEINQSRKFLINQVNEIKNINLENHNKTTYPSEQQFEDLCVKFCLYLDSDMVKSFTFNKQRLGILLTTDFYMSESQVNKLR